MSRTNAVEVQKEIPQKRQHLENVVPFTGRYEVKPQELAKEDGRRKANAAKPTVAKDIISYTTKSGEVRFRAQVRRDGKRLTEVFPSIKVAQAWQEKMRVGIREGEVTMSGVPAKMTMPELFNEYVKRNADDGHPLNTLELAKYRRLAGGSESQHSGAKVLAKVLVKDIDLATMIEYCKARKIADEMCPSSITLEYIAINSALKKMGLWNNWGGNRVYNPLDGVLGVLSTKNLVALSVERERRPTGEEMDSLLDHFKKTEAEDLVGKIRKYAKDKRMRVPMHDMVQFAALNGFRRGEIVKLRWADLDVDNSSIQCWRKDASQKGGANPGKRLCTVPLWKPAMAIILRQPRIKGDERIFPYKLSIITERFGQACTALKINTKATHRNDRLRFHDLRHEAISTFSTKMSLPEGMAVSGHKNPKNYLRYCNLKEAAKKIASLGDGITLKSARV